MTVYNDLTEEERAEFASHGVTFEDDAPAPPANDPPAPANDPPAPTTTAVPVTPPAVDPNAPAPAVDPNAPAPAAPPSMVPHAALHAERLRAAEATRRATLATTRMNALLAGREPAAPPPMPDLEQDPAAYIMALEARVAGFEGARQQEAEQRDMDTAIETDEATFALAQPDYEQAQAHYVSSRARELLHFYSPQETQSIMTNEVRQIARQSWERGMPAAQSIYQLAQARGYRAGQQDDPNPAPTPAPSAAPAPAPAPAAPKAPTAAAAVAAVRAGQAASASLSGASGTGGATQLNAEALLAMSDDEFETYLKLGSKGADQRFADIGGR